MNVLDSRIEGEAHVVFGGKIGFTLSSLKDVNESNVVLKLGELQEKLEVGEFVSPELKSDFQVNMIFNNPKSIDIVIDWLKYAKEELIDKLNKL